MSRNDALVQCSVNRKELATIALYMYEQGIRPRSMSELLRTIVETLAEILVNRMGAQRIERTDTADAVLKDIVKSSLNPGDRFKASMLKNLQEEYEDDELTPISNKKPNIERIINSRSDLTNKYAAIINHEAIKRGLIEMDNETKEDTAEKIRKGIAMRDASIEAEQLTPLQIQRNETILTAQTAKIAHYRQLADQFKTDKARAPYEEKIRDILKFAERAKNDDEALRILIDEI